MNKSLRWINVFLEYLLSLRSLHVLKNNLFSDDVVLDCLFLASPKKTPYERICLPLLPEYGSNCYVNQLGTSNIANQLPVSMFRHHAVPGAPLSLSNSGRGAF